MPMQWPIGLRDDGQLKCERFPVELTESRQEGKVYTALVSGHLSCVGTI